MARQVPLTKGKYAIVDDRMYDYISQWKWHYVDSHNGYAARREYPSGKYIYMHRQLTDADPTMDVDHINNDGLDNRMQNIRVCTTAQNLANRGILKTNTSGYRGVIYTGGKWVAQIGGRVNGRRVNTVLGRFDDPKMASAAYEKALIAKYGSFVKLSRKRG